MVNVSSRFTVTETFNQCALKSCRKRKQLPFDEEHQLSLSVCGADDAFRLQVSAGVALGVRLVLVWFEDAALTPGLRLQQDTSVQEENTEINSLLLFFFCTCRFHNS